MAESGLASQRRKLSGVVTEDPARERPSRSRVAIAIMLFVTVVINYLDRSNLSITALAMRTELGLDTRQMGLVLSAFGWTYAFLQIPGGWLVDRVAPRRLYAALILLWSMATIRLGFTYSVAGLMVVRMLVGVLEAPSYPMNNRVVTSWFPEGERASAIGFYISGQYIGIAFLTPVLVWIQSTIGWHMVFVTTGGLGIIWAVVWYIAYRDPRDSRRTNVAEIALIQGGGGLVDLGNRHRSDRPPVSRKDVRLILGSRKLWGVYFGQYAVSSTLWFFLTWFPTYLVQARGMDITRAGFLASLPFLAAFVGVNSSGLLSDFMVARHHAQYRTQGSDRRRPPAFDEYRRGELRRCARTDHRVFRRRLLRQWTLLDLVVARVGDGARAAAWPDQWHVQLHRKSARNNGADHRRLSGALLRILVGPNLLGRRRAAGGPVVRVRGGKSGAIAGLESQPLRA